MNDQFIIEPFIGSDGKYHFIYKIHNLVNGREYAGKHSTSDLNDGYFGSGKALNNALTKYGKYNFAMEFIGFYKTSKDAFLAEEQLVDEDYVDDPNTYNLMVGGSGLQCTQFAAKDNQGNIHWIDTTDQRFISGELSHHSKGTTFSINNPTQLTCPHCGKIGRSANMQRWHFDHCKENPNQIPPKKSSPRKPYKTVKCPHCKKTGSAFVMARWHFDNCKLR